MTLVEIFSLGHNPIPDEFNPTDLVEKLEEGWRPENPLSKYTDYVEMFVASYYYILRLFSLFWYNEFTLCE